MPGSAAVLVEWGRRVQADLDLARVATDPAVREMIAVPGGIERIAPAGDVLHVRAVEAVRTADREPDAMEDDRGPVPDLGEKGQAARVVSVSRSAAPSGK